ncbi:hypothetical protein ACIQUC_13020 [Curtobacterium sp. NPDC098951]|uniref:hypothetical protein n=1 Tax=Curtobacterium sp. NPDC098951 TaxID=3363974 RepID=UPI0037F8C5C1
MPEHKWAPPEHPDVTLHQPISFDAELAGPLLTIDPPKPVYADIAYGTIPDLLHLPCFAIAASEVAVLVETSWQGRRQGILVDRDHVVHRTLQPRAR